MRTTSIGLAALALLALYGCAEDPTIRKISIQTTNGSAEVRACDIEQCNNGNVVKYCTSHIDPMGKLADSCGLIAESIGAKDFVMTTGYLMKGCEYGSVGQCDSLVAIMGHREYRSNIYSSHDFPGYTYDSVPQSLRDKAEKLVTDSCLTRNLDELEQGQFCQHAANALIDRIYKLPMNSEQRVQYGEIAARMLRRSSEMGRRNSTKLDRLCSDLKIQVACELRTTREQEAQWHQEMGQRMDADTNRLRAQHREEENAREQRKMETLQLINGVATLAATASQGQARVAAAKQGVILPPARTGDPMQDAEAQTMQNLEAIRQNAVIQEQNRKIAALQQQEANSIQPGSSAALAGSGRETAPSGHLKQYSGPSLDSCIQGVFGGGNKFALKNACGQSLLVHYHSRSGPGAQNLPGVAILNPGEMHYTGDIGSADLNSFGGYEVAACPFGSGAVYVIGTPDSSYSGGIHDWKGGPYVCVAVSHTSYHY